MRAQKMRDDADTVRQRVGGAAARPELADGKHYVGADRDRQRTG